MNVSHDLNPPSWTTRTAVNGSLSRLNMCYECSTSHLLAQTSHDCTPLRGEASSLNLTHHTADYNSLPIQLKRTAIGVLLYFRSWLKGEQMSRAGHLKGASQNEGQAISRGSKLAVTWCGAEEYPTPASHD